MRHCIAVAREARNGATGLFAENRPGNLNNVAHAGPPELAAEAEHWLVIPAILDFVDAAASAGLKAWPWIPWKVSPAAKTEPSAYVVRARSGPDGGAFALPTRQDEIHPAFTEWLLERVPFLLLRLQSVPERWRAVVGFYGPEEVRANLSGMWREYYLAARLRRLLLSWAPDRLLTAYMPVISGVAAGHGLLAFGKFGNPPLALGGRGPESTTPMASWASEAAFAHQVLAQLGVGADDAKRYRLWDARGFLASFPGSGTAAQPTPPPTDARGFTSTFFDPSWRERVDEYRAAANNDTNPSGIAGTPSTEFIPFADASWPAFDDPDTYRPFESTSGYAASWYPVPDGLGFTQPVYRHLILSNYVDLALGPGAAVGPEQDRTWANHSLRRGIEARDGARAILGDRFRQAVEPMKVFHAPLLWGPENEPPLPSSAAYARHDFWAGLHQGEGVFIYNYAFSASNPAAWGAYAEGLKLLKGTHPAFPDVCVREFFVAGERLAPEEFGFVPAGVTGGVSYGNGLGYVPSYQVPTASAWRIGGRLLVVVTQSVVPGADAGPFVLRPGDALGGSAVSAVRLSGPVVLSSGSAVGEVVGQFARIDAAIFIFGS